MLVLKDLFGGSLKITSENKITFEAKKWPQKILRDCQPLQAVKATAVVSALPLRNPLAA